MKMEKKTLQDLSELEKQQKKQDLQAIVHLKSGKSLSQWFCLLGVLQIVFYLLQDILGAMNDPGYQWTRQAVSDLTAVDASSYMIAEGMAHIYGVLAVVSTSMLCIRINKKGNSMFRLGIVLFTVMNWISCIGYSMFPLSASGYAGKFQDIMHVFVITALVVVLSIISLLFITIGGFREKSNLRNDEMQKKERKAEQILAILALICLVCMIGGAVGSGLVDRAYFGIVERFSTYSAVVFGSALAFYGFQSV